MLDEVVLVLPGSARRRFDLERYKLADLLAHHVCGDLDFTDAYQIAAPRR
jgi:hypothetical protein